jgi:hypothetical protein
MRFATDMTSKARQNDQKWLENPAAIRDLTDFLEKSSRPIGGGRSGPRQLFFRILSRPLTRFFSASIIPLCLPVPAFRLGKSGSPLSNGGHESIDPCGLRWSATPFFFEVRLPVSTGQGTGDRGDHQLAEIASWRHC